MSSSMVEDHEVTRGKTSDRVILLLDLDCFYAQAACIRLGYEAATTALALFQWNSVLAVTYPARKFGVKRGDSWDDVQQKARAAGQHCYGVHVPILTTEAATAKQQPPSLDIPSLEQDYAQLYMLDTEQQRSARSAELGVRKYSSDGKASIECFRVASARIFQCVRLFLETQYPSGTVLERASIDEFFLDVTGAARLQTHGKGDLKTENRAFGKTVVVNEASQSQECNFPGERELELRRGCRIAHEIRVAVYDELGFTMSAGIGCNKTLAKLTASFGKPAGQAICFPYAISSMLYETKISSCRNLGGKLGSSVQNLLPNDAPPTVGSIARYLSLPTLKNGLKDTTTALWVYNIARGIDPETVESKTKDSAVLTKSITAFKSLNFPPKDTPKSGIGHTLEESERWIQLLAKEVVTRVERDASRNDRYPRNCTIQYAATQTRNNKSMRIAFPSARLSTDAKVAELANAVPNTIRAKEKGVFRLYRIGLCATEFQSRGDCMTKAIDTYFSTAPASKKHAVVKTQGASTTETYTVKSEKYSRQIPSLSKGKNSSACDADLELARKLQASYDRENDVIQVLDASSKKRKSNSLHQPRRIDTFFQKKG